MSDPCPVPECNYNSNLRQYDEELCRPLILQSTRSNEDVDAHRDMDGFDVDEELARLRRALVVEEKTPEVCAFIVEAFMNIDESLRREGDLPKAWWAAARTTADLHW